MEREEKNRLFFIVLVVLIFIAGAYVFGVEVRPAMHDTTRPAPRIDRDTTKYFELRKN